MKYTFKKGWHYAWHWFKLYFSREGLIEHTVNFSKECVYSFGSIEDFDVNKLFGRSFGLHHKNSVRFGWRANAEKKTILIYMYNYKDGIRQIKELCSCIPGRSYTFKIKYNKKVALFEVSEKNWKTKFSMEINAKTKLGYKLYPYFGGTNPAPHKMSIEIL